MPAALLAIILWRPLFASLVDPILRTGSHPSNATRVFVGLRPMAEKEGLTRCARGFALSLRLLHLRFAPSNSVRIPARFASVLIWLRPMAEKEGFEPPVPFPVQLISSQSHSATLPLLHTKGCGRNYIVRGLQALTDSGTWCGMRRDRSSRRAVPRNGHFATSPQRWSEKIEKVFWKVWIELIYMFGVCRFNYFWILE